MTGFINKIGMDKIAHFSLGGFICALFTILFVLQDYSTLYTMSPWRIAFIPTIGTVVTFVISVIKELIIDDTCDWKDILAAMIGCGVVYVINFIGIIFNLFS